MANIVKELLIKITTNAKQAVSDIKNFRKNVDELGDDVKDASGEVKDFSKTASSTGDEVQKAGKKIKTAGVSAEDYGDSAQKAKGDTKELTKGVKEMIAPLDDAKGAMDAFKGVLGAFGVTTLFSGIIEEIKTVIEKADEARDKIARLNQVMSYKYNLNAEQKSIVADISSTKNGGVGYAGDAEDLTKIVGAVSALNVGATTAELTNLSEEYMYLAERGFGTLDTTVREANIMFDQFGITIGEQPAKLEYLRSVSEKTLIPLDTLITMLQDASSIAKEYGLSMEDTASMIGESTLENAGSTKEIEDFIDTYEDVLSDFITADKTKIGEQLTEGITDTATKNAILEANEELITAQATSDAETYMQTYSQAMLDLINSGKYAVEGGTGSKQVIQLSRSNTDWETADKNSKDWEKYTGTYTEGTRAYDIKEASKYTGMGGTGTIVPESALESLDELDEKVEGSFDILSGLKVDGVDPLNTSFELTGEQLTNNLLASTTLNDYSIGTLQPTLNSEKTTVDGLTQAYLALAAAKSAAGEA